MKAVKLRTSLSVIAVLYILYAVWSTVARVITVFLNIHADSSATFIFSYVNNSIDALLIGVGLAVMFGLASAGSLGRQRLSFRLGMSGSLVFCAYFLFYLLFAASSNILYVNLVLIAVFGGLECSMLIMLALSEDKKLRIFGFIAAGEALIAAAVLFLQLFSSLMMMLSSNTLYWMLMLSRAGRISVFIDAIHGVFCALFFFLSASYNQN